LTVVRASVASVLLFLCGSLVLSGSLSGDDGSVPVRTTIGQDASAESALDARYLASAVFPRRPVSLSSSDTTTVIRFRGPAEGKDRFLVPDLRRYRVNRAGAAPISVLFLPRNPFDLLPRLVVWDAERGTNRFVRPAVGLVAQVSEAKDTEVGVLPGGGTALLSSASLANAKPADATLDPPGDRWVMRVRVEERLPGDDGNVIPWRQAGFDLSTGVATWDWTDPALGHRVVLAAGIFKEDGQDAYVALSVDVLRDVQSPLRIQRVRPVGIEEVRRMVRGVPSEVSLSSSFGVRSSHLVAILEIR
jgi:hypothetical protein